MRLHPAHFLRATIILILLLPFTKATAEAQGNSLPARLERAVALIGDNRLSEAEQQLNSILKAMPEQADALNLLGAIRAQQGKMDEAESLFKRAVSAKPQLSGARMNLAYLYMLKGSPENSILELKEAIRLEPNNADAAQKLARLLLSQNRIDECISFIETRSRPLPPAMFAALGDAYWQKGEEKKAEENYLLALSGGNEDADALIGLARISQSRNDAKTVSRYLTHARERAANSPDLLYRCALIALQAELYDEAMRAIDGAIHLKPEEPSYIFISGVAWLKKADLLEAEQSFRRFLKHQPDNSEGQLYLGYALLKQKKHAEARQWLERSVQAGNGSPESFYYLGLIAQEQNEDERAIELFEKAIRLSPSFAHAHIALGSTLLKLKNYSRAQQELEIGVKLNPEDSKAHYNLAVLYARLKDHERAQEQMRIVEKLKSAGKGGEQDVYVLTPSPRRPR